jgi:hypothetical protein
LHSPVITPVAIVLDNLACRRYLPRLLLTLSSIEEKTCAP